MTCCRLCLINIIDKTLKSWINVQDFLKDFTIWCKYEFLWLSKAL